MKKHFLNFFGLAPYSHVRELELQLGEAEAVINFQCVDIKISKKEFVKAMLHMKDDIIVQVAGNTVPGIGKTRLMNVSDGENVRQFGDPAFMDYLKQEFPDNFSQEV